MLPFIRIYFRILSGISYQTAGKQAIRLFQRTFSHRRRFRERELRFYRESGYFRTTWVDEDLHCYEWGDPSHHMVLLIHGWNSNAGSMHSLAHDLVQHGCYVVALDLPAHGHSALRTTNLMKCSSAFRALIQRLLPQQPFSVVSHSFGSAVVAHALSGSRFRIDRWAMLTSPDQVRDIFREYKESIGLGERSYVFMQQKAEEILGEKLSEVTVVKKLESITYSQLLLLHDPLDRMLPFANAEAIAGAAPAARLVTLEGTGHYRMLSDQKVVGEVRNFILASSFVKQAGKKQAALYP